jgi:hypothetical protein
VFMLSCNTMPLRLFPKKVRHMSQYQRAGHCGSQLTPELDAKSQTMCGEIDKKH